MNSAPSILLTLASRGNAVLAEIRRLSQALPNSLYENEGDGNHSTMIDFRYFQEPDRWDGLWHEKVFINM